MSKTDLEPSLRLYRKVRAVMVEQNVTLAEVARELGVARNNIRPALTGEWDGPKGRDVRNRVLIRAGLVQADAA